LLLALPRPLAVGIVERMVRRACEIRFVASSLREALLSALPPALAKELEVLSSVRPASLEVPRPEQLDDLFPSAGARACVIARLVASKRVDLAIAAANELGSSLRLDVVGDGPELERLVRLDRLGNVVFRGQLPREQAMSILAHSDVLLHPSEAEAAPTVVREARLLGRPVVACAAGDIGLWSMSDEGIVVVAHEAEAIARAARRWVGGRVSS
jgi:glycosyltransferase involved in cell wall biosynthesis